jgi:hypothetical protein
VLAAAVSDRSIFSLNQTVAISEDATPISAANTSSIFRRRLSNRNLMDV